LVKNRLLWRTREAHHPVKDVETVPIIWIAIEAIRACPTSAQMCAAAGYSQS